MIVEYELTLEDMLTVGAVFYPEPTSAGYLKARIGYSLWTGLLVFLFLCCVTHAEAPINAVLVGLIFAAGWFLAIPSWYRRGLRRQLLSYYSGDTNRLFRGDRALEISDSGFIVQGKESEQRYAWSAIQHVSVRRDFMLIYIASAQVHAIPLARVRGGVSVAAFLEELRQHVPEGKIGNAQRWRPGA